MTITHSCNSSGALRITHDHLVLTSNGFREASTLVSGIDVVFANMDLSVMCQVLDVRLSNISAFYFGLNCRDVSVVIADGFVASVFGTFHQGPALWMTYATKILGLDMASALGDFFSRAYFFFVK